MGVTGAPWASEIFNYLILAPVIIYHDGLSYEFMLVFCVFYVLCIIFCALRF